MLIFLYQHGPSCFIPYIQHHKEFPGLDVKKRKKKKETLKKETLTSKNPWKSKFFRASFYFPYLLIVEKTKLISGQYETLNNPYQNLPPGKVFSWEQILQFQIRCPMICSLLTLIFHALGKHTWLDSGVSEHEKYGTMLEDCSLSLGHDWVHDSRLIVIIQTRHFYKYVHLCRALKEECALQSSLLP